MPLASPALPQLLQPLVPVREQLQPVVKLFWIAVWIRHLKPPLLAKA
jgi:hypothetical protein